MTIMSNAEENVNIGRTGGSQNNCTPGTPPFMFQTPPINRQPRAVVRLKTTLVEAMDDAHKIENDIAIQDRTTTRSMEKRKWEASSDSLKKKSHHQIQSDKPEYCKKCHSSHRGPCNSSTVSCIRCGKMGHRHEDCKSTELMCYNCRQMGHISAQCPNPKVEMDVGGKKDEASKVKARAFNMTTDEVTFRTFLVNYIHAYVSSVLVCYPCLCVTCDLVLSDASINKYLVSLLCSYVVYNELEEFLKLNIMVSVLEPVVTWLIFDICVISFSEHIFPMTLIHFGIIT
uniref:CCHC-type domain-containing protein n=1 Tax=Lactuca sativa TaxID=4236 RepID=A0A9R1XBY2_LACSA|nr:hypothetical protein LSAT_V11C500260300 [Lactuca sativa]